MDGSGRKAVWRSSLENLYDTIPRELCVKPENICLKLCVPYECFIRYVLDGKEELFLQQLYGTDQGYYN